MRMGLDPFLTEDSVYRSTLKRTKLDTKWKDEMAQMGANDIRILRANEDNYYLVLKEGVYHFARNLKDQIDDQGTYNHSWNITFYRTEVDLGRLNFPNYRLLEVMGTYESMGIDRDSLFERTLPSSFLEPKHDTLFGIDEHFNGLTRNHPIRVISIPSSRLSTDMTEKINRVIVGGVLGGLATVVGSPFILYFGRNIWPISQLKLAPQEVMFAGMGVMIGIPLLGAAYDAFLKRDQNGLQKNFKREFEDIIFETINLDQIKKLAKGQESFVDLNIGVLRLSDRNIKPRAPKESQGHWRFWDTNELKSSRVDLKNSYEWANPTWEINFSGRVILSGKFEKQGQKKILKISKFEVRLEDPEFESLGIQQIRKNYAFEILYSFFGPHNLDQIELIDKAEILISGQNEISIQLGL